MLSRDEIDRLLQCTSNLKHRTFLMVLYSAGLRFSEAASLRIADIEFTNLQNDAAWEAFCESLESVDWVSFIQPPPSEDASADQVVRYLTRYLTGGPISDRRIMAANRQQVTILARESVRVGGDRQQVPLTMPIADFTRRWCLHIQPNQLPKVRHFGGWSCPGTRTCC